MHDKGDHCLPVSGYIKLPVSSLERYVLIGDLGRGMLLCLRGALIKGRACAARGTSLKVAATTFSASAQQHQVAGYDLSTVLFLSTLFVFPAGGLQPAFNVDLGTFFYILANNFRQPLPRNNVVPLRAVLPFTALIFVALVRGQGEFGDGGPTGCEFNFRVFSQIPYQNDFIYAFCHGRKFSFYESLLKQYQFASRLTSFSRSDWLRAY